MFELASLIESYLYKNKVFEWMDGYEVNNASDNPQDGWLGAFEYIGSKKVDTNKLNAIRNDLS